ncbi:hypothetical protein ABT336_00205 [Micromonospora sp. NPDC000207]|uniref:hypothetical protein n=1 Tax=Micromonospora sp. NPDC000207 TaxID=3154246 RepID=UPI003325B08D
MTWRYIAQRATTREWLDWDLDLRRDELTRALSGPGSLRGTLSPDVGRLRAPDGRLLLEPWGTLLYAEADGQIRWGGIVVSSQTAGATWSIEAAGMTTYPHGLPYLDEWSRVQVDPANAIREIWRHVQDQPDGDLGMIVDPTTTPVRLGTPGVPSYQEVQLDGAWVRRDSVPASRIVPSAQAKLAAGMDNNDTTLTLQAIDKFDQLSPPYLVTIGSETVRVNGRSGRKLTGLQRGIGSSTAAGHGKGVYVKHAGTPVRTVDAVPAEPYLLAWWEAQDCGGEIDTIARETPLDYAEEHAWAGDQVEHRLRLGYPRLGRRRTDLAFEQGVNVVSLVGVDRDGAEYANEVIGLGSGEGRKALIRRHPTRDGRLRRAAVYTDKSIRHAPRLDSICRAELGARQHIDAITSVEVVDHPHARIGSWQMGDDVLIRAHTPWAGEVSLWHRIVGDSLLSDTRASLTLRRSDSFNYGTYGDA